MNNKGYRKILIIGISLVVVTSLIIGLFFGVINSLSVLAAGLGILGVFVYYTEQRYKDIEALNSYLSKVLMGNYDLDIQKNEEGELSILQNNIYKATVLLQEKNEQLEKEKTYLVDMLANISHQLKTPLTSVVMMNDLILREESEKKRQEFIEIEQSQINKMNWLIKNLLKLSKLDAGTIQLKEENVSVTELIEESLAPFMLQMDLSDICVEKKLNDSILRIDKGWTAEALGNIIKNCIEHMDNGGHLEIESMENNLYQVIFIRDNGCGIDKEDLPHIFERFYRGKGSKKDSVGIGLALSKSIINKERGVVIVTSEVGCGTCFEIRFSKSII